MVHKSNYNKRKPINVRKYYFLIHEKRLLEQNYDFIKCEIKLAKGNYILEVLGHYQQVGLDYTYKIIYDGIKDPHINIVSPIIVRNPPHVYPKDGCLCLYYPIEQPWNTNVCSLYSHIIPWVHEWIVYYEIWKITGNWEHPEVLHNNK